MLDKATITKAAQKFVAKGQIDKAIAEWEKLLKEGHDGNVYNIVGDLYLRKKAKNEATEAFSKAAAIFREEGFYLKAIALYKKILNVAPLEVDAYISLAELNAEKGLIGNASENYLAAAEVYIKEGSAEKALEIYQEILKLTPSNINLRLKISELYLKIGLKEEAVKEYISIASHYLEKREIGKAQEFYLKAIGFDSQNVTALIGMSKVAENEGNIKQAYEYLNKAMTIDPDNCDVLFNYSKVALETNNIDSAKQALSKLVEVEPSNNQYKKVLGAVYLEEGLLEKSWEVLLPCIDEALSAEKWDEAHKLLENFKELDPVAVRRRLSTIYKGKDDKDAAIKELRALVGICEEKGLAQEALQSYKELFELNPSDKAVQNKIKKLEKELGIEEIPLEDKPVEEALAGVDEYIRQGLLKEAISSLKNLNDREPDNIEIHTRLKDFYIKSKEKDKAIDECLAIAELYEKKGDLESKNTIIAEATSLNPDDPRLVAISMTSPDVEEVGVSYEEGTVPRTKEPQKIFKEQLEEADFYTQQGLTDEAINLYEKLLSSSPDNEEIKKKLRDIKSAEMPEGKPAEETTVSSDLKDIFHEFKKGIEEELGVEDCETRYNLGIAYKEMGLLEDAIREFKIAAKDPKKTVQSSSMLALCYMEKKLYPLAIQEFKKATEAMSPSDKGYLAAKCELADAYVKNKDYKNSLKLYTEIYSQDPKFGDVARKVEIIKKLVSEGKEKPKSKKDRVSYI